MRRQDEVDPIKVGWICDWPEPPKTAAAVMQYAYDEGPCLRAAEQGANAVVAMRYDSNDITDGITEMLAYGTAVVVEEI